MTPGQTLRALRETRALSREALALAVGYDARTIARWEADESRPRDVVFRYLQSLAPSTGVGDRFTFIDLFAGIGGFRMAFESAGGRCLFTSEWNKYAQQTYRANFGDHEVHGDITKIAPVDVPDHDILLAGFPCQPFSIAGVSKKNALGRKHGFECETQGTLFFNIEKIIEAKQPKAFVLENVKNLLSHDRGNTYAVIDRALKRLGYRVEPRVIDARVVVPQHRERIFLVGIREDLGLKFDWSTVRFPARQSTPVMRDVLHGAADEGIVDARYQNPDGSPLPKYTLTPKLWQYLKDYAAKHRSKGNGFGYGLVGPGDVARTISARYYKDGSEILVRRGNGRPRRLTPRECARLMGFDRPGRPRFRIPVSDTQAYRQFGNAVVVPVVEAIAFSLVEHLEGRCPAKAAQDEVIDRAGQYELIPAA